MKKLIVILLLVIMLGGCTELGVSIREIFNINVDQINKSALNSYRAGYYSVEDLRKLKIPESEIAKYKPNRGKPNMKDRIISLGMSSSEINANIGSPIGGKIYGSQSKYGYTSIYIYETKYTPIKGYYGRVYLFFDDFILTRISY